MSIQQRALACIVVIVAVVMGPSAAYAINEPVLVSTTPTNNAHVQAISTVSATYNRAIDEATSTIVLKDRTGTSIPGTTSFTDPSSDVAEPGDKTIVFTPDPSALPLSDAGSPYAVTVVVQSTHSGPLKSQPVNTGWNFTVDTMAPGTPTIASVEGDTTSPAAGNDTTPTIVVSNVVAGHTVRILEGATVRGSKVVPAGATTVTINAVESGAGSSDATLSGDGNHTLTATSTDLAGNVSPASPGFVYALDTTAPAVPTITSVEGDNASPAAGNDTTPTIVVDVSLLTAGDTLMVYDGATLKGSALVPSSPATITFNATEPDSDIAITGDGVHPFTARSTDPLGNQSAASAVFNYTLDTTAPAAPTISSVEGDSTTPAAGNDTTPTVVVSNVVAGDTVRILEGITVLGTKVAAGTTVTFNAVESGAGFDEVLLSGNGNHNLTATSTDPNANASPASGVFVYYLDQGATPPALVGTFPEDGTTVRPPSTVSATYDEALHNGSTITLRNEVGNIVGGTQSFSADNKTIIFTPSSALVETGTNPYEATVVARDVNGNQATPDVWTFHVDATAPAAPTIASVEADTSSPAAGNDPTPTIVVSGVQAGHTVKILDAAAVVGSKVVPAEATTVTFNASESGGGSAEVTLTGDTNHSLTATSTDVASNVSNQSAAFVYALDTTAPAAPTVTSVEGDPTTPAAGNDATPTVVVSNVVAGDTVRILEGITVLGTKVAAGTTVTFNTAEGDADLTVSPDGDHSLTATSTDAVANVSPVSAAFVYARDTAPPATPTITSVEGNTTSPALGNDPTPTIVVSNVVAGDTVKILEGATTRGTLVVPGGATTVTFNATESGPGSSDVTLSGESSHSLTATSADPVTNTSPASPAFVYTLDTVVPATPAIPSVEGDNTSPATANDPTPTIVVSTVVAGDTVRIFEGTTVLGTLVVPGGATTVTFNSVESGAGDSDVTIIGDGNHSLTATSTDAASNTSAASPAFVYNLQTAAPNAPAIASIEADTTTPAAGNDTTPSIVVSGVTQAHTVTILEGTTVRASKVVPNGATTVTFNSVESGAGSTDVTLAGDGDHTLTATATDTVGNISGQAPEFVYSLDTTAPAAPTIDSVEGDTASPAAGSDPTPVIVVSNVVAGDTVTLLEGATTRGTLVVPGGLTSVTFNSVESGAGSTDVTLAGDGDHTLTATSTDAVTNTSPASTAFVYALDTTVPATPTIDSIEGDTTSPAAGSDATPTLVISGVVAGDTVRVLEGATVRGTKVVPAGDTSVTFNPAESDADVTLSGVGDHALTATASDPLENLSAASATFVYTMQPTIAISDVTVTEGNAGTAPANFTVTLSAPSTQTVTVAYSTANGTATAPGDFTASSGTVTFTAGQVVQTVAVPVVGNTQVEPDETYSVNLSAAVNAGIVDAQGLGTIVNDDQATSPTTPPTTAPRTTPPTTTPPTTQAPARTGYWLVARDGGIFAFGDAVFRGSTGAMRLAQPIVGMARTPSGNGYHLVAADGGIFAFGDAVFRGSTGAIRLNQPIVGMSSTPSGNGYWLVARDGGIFAFGDAVFRGSTGAIRLNQPIVGMSSTPSGNGYHLVAADGGIFAFGDAVFRGSTGALRLAQPIVGMARTPSGNGYHLVAADGGIFAFGDAVFRGSTGATRLAQPIVGMAPSPSGNGYHLVAADGGIFAFGDAVFRGSTGAMRLAQPIVGMAPLP